jgi:hypothetical protein
MDLRQFHPSIERPPLSDTLKEVHNGKQKSVTLASRNLGQPGTHSHSLPWEAQT